MNLANNRLTNLADILPLASLPNLRRLSLLDNQITKKENYRLYVIFHLPKLQLLDYHKVKSSEREASVKLFSPLNSSNKASTEEDPMKIEASNQVEAIKV